MREDIINERRKKAAALAEQGVSAYPVRAERSMTIREARRLFDELSQEGKSISLAGRVMTIRDQGALIFADIKDETGVIQLFLKKNEMENFALIKNAIDRGDFISATGTLFRTKSEEQTLQVKSAAMLAKALRPLPENWYGLEDEEIRLRKRYLDFIMNPEVKDIFAKKAKFWRTFRDALAAEGFTEVETPVLEALPGGAEAEPFVTHHNALDTDFYLRISLELSLKKLLVGGFEKVFEIGRIFRNEGIDREHLQDYTQLEFYWAYSDYEDLMKLVEKIYKKVVMETTGSLVTQKNGVAIDWSGEWPKVDYVRAFNEKNEGVDCLEATQEQLYARAKELGCEATASMGRGRLIDLIYKKTVRPALVQPCFLVNPPVAIEPLAKRSEKDPRVVERFQVMAGGTELGKGFSELNDPIDQRERFEEQQRLRAQGDAEAQYLDEDFLEALEYGMPPASGFGTSERLFSVLLDKPIRECVMFPLMRPKGDQ